MMRHIRCVVIALILLAGCDSQGKGKTPVATAGAWITLKDQTGWSGPALRTITGGSSSCG